MTTFSEIDRQHTITTSPSAIETYEGCPRKWVYQSIMRIQSEPTRGQLFGRAVDEQIEAVLAGRQATTSFSDYRVGETAQRLLDLTPRYVLDAPRQTHLEGRDPRRVEQPWVRLESRGRFVVVGRPDLVYLSEVELLVVDYKTTSNLRWAQTAESLPANVQAQFYSAAMMATQSAHSCDVMWLTAERSAAIRTQTANISMGLEDARMFLTRAQSATDGMRRTRLAVLGRCSTASEAPASEQDAAAQLADPNLSHCDAYGGCPFRARCYGQQTTTREETQMGDAFSIFDQIQKNMQTANVPDFPSTVPPATANVQEQPTTEAVAEQPAAGEQSQQPRRRGRPPKTSQPAPATSSERPLVETAIDVAPSVEAPPEPTTEGLVVEASRDITLRLRLEVVSVEDTASGIEMRIRLVQNTR